MRFGPFTWGDRARSSQPAAPSAGPSSVAADAASLVVAAIRARANQDHLDKRAAPDSAKPQLPRTEPGFLDPQLAPDFKLYPGHANMARRVLERPGPVALHNLPEPLVIAFEQALPDELRPIATRQPHPGITKNPFDFSQLRSITPEEKKAVLAYLDQDFVRLPLDKKEVVLKQLERVFTAEGRAITAAFHLPRKLSSDSNPQPITVSLEAESVLAERPEVLNYYAPDPSGVLDARVQTADLMKLVTASPKDMLREGALPRTWLRMTPDQQRDSLRWKDLSLIGRMVFLALYSKVDPKVPLFRIKDPACAPEGNVAPKTLKNELLWEGTPLGVSEITTGSYYQSLDQLFADIQFIHDLGLGRKAGFHVHHVFELSTPEDVKTIAPKATGVAALLDLFLFTRSLGHGGNLLHHTHLEVWKASDVNDVAKSFADGKLDPDAIDIHKFHCVGMRLGIYGQDNRLGLEVRGVPVGSDTLLEGAVDRVTKILGNDHADKLGSPPPWDWWNAGDPALPNKAYEAAVKNNRLLAESAAIDFDTILEMAAGPTADRDKFKYASPFWNYEALPGMTEKDVDQIEHARRKYTEALLQISVLLTGAVEGGRELDTAKISQGVELALRRFHAASGVDAALARAFVRASNGESA